MSLLVPEDHCMPGDHILLRGDMRAIVTSVSWGLCAPLLRQVAWVWTEGNPLTQTCLVEQCDVTDLLYRLPDAKAIYDGDGGERIPIRLGYPARYAPVGKPVRQQDATIREMRLHGWTNQGATLAGPAYEMVQSWVTNRDIEIILDRREPCVVGSNVVSAHYKSVHVTPSSYVRIRARASAGDYAWLCGDDEL